MSLHLPQRSQRRLGFEALEKRRVLASLVVTTAGDTVDPDDGVLSLREAISLANQNAEADEITFDRSLDGVPITLTRGGSGEDVNATGDLDLLVGSIAIIGNGIEATLIDGGGDTGLGDSLFNPADAVDAAFRDLTIRGGRGTFGGGIFDESSGTLVIERVRFTDNAASSSGGAVASSTGGRVTIGNSVFEGNRAEFGGAIVAFGSLTLARSTLRGNVATSSGGGIQLQEATANVVVSDSTFMQNAAGIDGGAIANNRGMLRVIQSTLSGNSAAEGGAIATSANGANTTATTRIDSSTITQNATADAAALDAFASGAGATATLSFGNTIVVGNTGGAGGSANLSRFADDGAVSTLTSLGNNLLSDSGRGAAVASDLVNVPADGVIEAALADNGGPTLTHALVDSPNNPAIDGGNFDILATVDTPPTTDQRGFAARNDTLPMDIGAFEVFRAAPADFVINSSDDDLAVGDEKVTLRDAIFVANMVPGIDTITNTTSRTIFLLGGELSVTESLRLVARFDEQLVVDAAAQSRILNVIGDDVDLTLVNLGLLNGLTTGNNRGFGGRLETTHSGGAIRFASTGRLMLMDTFIGDSGTRGRFAYGGAVYIGPGGDLNIERSTIIQNRTEGSEARGGAIYVDSGTVTIANAFINSNQTMGDGASGGGVFVSRGEVALVATRIISNTMFGENTILGGGGITVGGGSLSIVNSTIDGNRTVATDTSGGGIATNSATLSILNSTVSSNHASGAAARGGGIATMSQSVTITNSTLSGNTATGGGGAYFNDRGLTRIVGSTVTNNTAGFVGGGIGGDFNVNNGRRLEVENSIIAGNVDIGNAPDFIRPDGPTQNLVVRSSIIGDLTGTSLDPNTDDHDNVLGIDWREILVNDGTTPLLRNNGGLTRTHALIDLPGNVAIDSGDSAFAVDADGVVLRTDQRGLTSPRDTGGGIDRGAFELGNRPGDIYDFISGPGEILYLRNGVSFQYRSAPDVALVLQSGRGNDIYNIGDFDSSGAVTSPLSVFDEGGDDIYRLAGADQTLDLTLPDFFFSGVETLDLRGVGSNSLIFNTANVLTQTGGTSSLTVRMDPDDTATRVQVETEEPLLVTSSSVVDGELAVTAIAGDASVTFVGARWTHPLNRFDVNADGRTTALDALRIINYLNQPIFDTGGEGTALVDPATLPAFPLTFYDVSGNNFATALDALQVINELNRQNTAGQPEPELHSNIETKNDDRPPDRVLADAVLTHWGSTEQLDSTFRPRNTRRSTKFIGTGPNPEDQDSQSTAFSCSSGDQLTHQSHRELADYSVIAPLQRRTALIRLSDAAQQTIGSQMPS